MKKPVLVIMAAGMGSRYGGLKQIDPVGRNGEIILDYSLFDAKRAGFEKAIIVIKRENEALFREVIGDRASRQMEIQYAYQEMDDLPEGFSIPEGRKKPWGTGHAVLACRGVIREPFCVLNADDYYGPEAFVQIHEYIGAAERPARELDCCMAGYVLGNTLSESGAVTRGICKVDGAGKLCEIRETRGILLRDGAPCVERDGTLERLDPESAVSMNIWGLPAGFIDYLEEGFPQFLQRLGEEDLTSEYLLPSIIGKMIRRGEGSVQVLPTADKWFGMTYAQDKRQTQEKIRSLIEQGAYPEQL